MTAKEQVKLWRVALPAEVELIVEDGGPRDDFGIRLRFTVHDQACRVDLSQAGEEGPWRADIYGTETAIETLEDVWQAVASEFARRLTEARQALMAIGERVEADLTAERGQG